MFKATSNYSYKIVALIVLWSCFKWSEVLSCTCPPRYFCEELKTVDLKIAIEATALHHKVYPQNDAVYLRVDKIFRDDVGITNVIKLYGLSMSADCHVNVLSQFPDGAKVYLIIGLQYNGQDAHHEFVNPDAAYENWWEIAPFSCFTVVLTVKNGIVSGPIQPDIREYPLHLFEAHLENCDYSIEELNISRCQNLPFVIYPNPSPDGRITIRNQYRYTAIRRIRIFDTIGRLWYDEAIAPGTFQKAIVDLSYSGFYILEFHCDESTFYEKILVE